MRLFASSTYSVHRSAIVLNAGALGLCLLSNPAQAQVPPGAGALQREVNQNQQLQQPKARPRPAADQPGPQGPASERIKLKAFIVEGASLIPQAELEALLSGYSGQLLDLNDLNAAAQLLTNHYRAKGWYARAILPAQDITAGSVRIQIIEAHYGTIQRTDQGKRTKGDFIQRMVLQGHQPGDPLSATRLERGILLANDLPGTKASILLEPGQKQGDTRINLTTDDTALLTGDLGINNYGLKSTGTTQLIGGIALNGPTGYGDQLSLRHLATDGLNNTTLNYSLPLGTNGLRLSAYGSYLDYTLGDRFKALDATGDADTLGLGLGWAWIRQTDRNLNLSLNGEQRNYADDMLGAAIRRHRVKAITLGLNGDRSDSIAGGGLSWGNLRLISGEVDIHSVAADKAIDQATARTDGHYNKVAFSLNRLQNLGDSGFRILAALNGQLAGKNLHSSEQMSLGGPDGVRAFPVNEATGDQGAILRLELQRPLAQGWQVAAFADAGTIQQHKDTWTGWNTPLNRPNSYSLSGAGLALSWNQPGNVAFNASIAKAISGNPGRDARGRNNDGSKVDDTRLWATLTKAF
jgi:hemolysin activation/secretion protein